MDPPARRTYKDGKETECMGRRFRGGTCWIRNLDGAYAPRHIRNGTARKNTHLFTVLICLTTYLIFTMEGIYYV